MITQKIDKKRATQMARNLSRHLTRTGETEISHSGAMNALAATLG